MIRLNSIVNNLFKASRVLATLTNAVRPINFILKMVVKEIGFENALVHEIGGALVRFEPDGAITIYGASEEFGACDKEFVAEMVRKEFRGRTIKVRD